MPPTALKLGCVIPTDTPPTHRNATQMPLSVQDLSVLMLRTLFSAGTYVHWRNTVKLLMLPPAHRAGLQLTRVPAGTFGGRGMRDSWWITLAPDSSSEPQASPQPAKVSCVLLYLHGEWRETLHTATAVARLWAGVRSVHHAA